MSEATEMDERGDGIESLMDAVIDGRCSASELRQFEDLVRDDPQVRRAYLDQMRIHALLEWRNGRVEWHVDRPKPARVWWPARASLRSVVSAVVLIGVGLAFLLLRSQRERVRGDEIATVVEAKNVVWAEGQRPLAVNARLSPRVIRCESGILRLAFDSGALVTVKGPADLRILSGMRLRAVRGRITARVEGDAKGFTIETPNTLVVDQGTEFGVEVDASGETDVVVFEGLVDLARPKSPGSPSEVKRLTQGEALRIDRSGVLSRIYTVERRAGEDGWSTGPSLDRDAVIRLVRDNIRGLGSSKYYQIVHRGLDEDAQAYVDRPHQWNGLDSKGLPKLLRGADYIMTFNDDKWTNGLEITVELARGATLYVFLDDRERPPAWLTKEFTDTKFNIGLDETSWPDSPKASLGRGPGRSVNQVFSVWMRDVDRDTSVRLGSLEGGMNNRAMYGIAAVARPSLMPSSPAPKKPAR